MLADSDFNFKSPKGFFVVDGVNGAGKSTVLRRLEELLRKRGTAFLLTREPGGTSLGTSLRTILLSSTEPLTPLAELFLFSADRTTHVHSKILPALRSGTAVLSDRYHYSTTAFQGYGRGLDLETIHTINEAACGGLAPDGVLLLDLPVEEGLRRAAARRDGQDNFESEDIAFHERIRQGFLTIAAQRSEPFFVVDARAPVEAVCAQCAAIVERWIAAWEKELHNE